MEREWEWAVKMLSKEASVDEDGRWIKKVIQCRFSYSLFLFVRMSRPPRCSTHMFSLTGYSSLCSATATRCPLPRGKQLCPTCLFGSITQASLSPRANSRFTKACFPRMYRGVEVVFPLFIPLSSAWRVRLVAQIQIEIPGKRHYRKTTRPRASHREATPRITDIHARAHQQSTGSERRSRSVPIIVLNFLKERGDGEG